MGTTMSKKKEEIEKKGASQAEGGPEVDVERDWYFNALPHMQRVVFMQSEWMIEGGVN